MRNISFALTTAQIRDRSKTVTRRLGWKTLKVGTLLQPVVKSQGLKKGERVEPIGGPIRVLDVRQEPLQRVRFSGEVEREGFPQLYPIEFISMFCRTHRGCTEDTVVTRIEFEFVEEPA